MIKSWKTTLFGILTAASLGVGQADKLGVKDVDPEIQKYATVLALTLGAITAGFARDNNKSSEDVGAKKEGPK